MKEDQVYLRYILDCIRRIEEDTSGGRGHFLSSRTHQDAVLRNLQTMSETTQRLSNTIKQCYPVVEWDRIAAFRNVLVHDYLGIDVEQVWAIVQKDVPVLKQTVSTMLSKIERQE